MTRGRRRYRDDGRLLPVGGKHRTYPTKEQTALLHRVAFYRQVKSMAHDAYVESVLLALEGGCSHVQVSNAARIDRQVIIRMQKRARERTRTVLDARIVEAYTQAQKDDQLREMMERVDRATVELGGVGGVVADPRD